MRCAANRFLRHTPAMSARIIRKEVVVPAPRLAVWQAWTTREGVKSFFAPDARIELEIGGPYEILFMLDAPAGSQGSEGCKVLLFDTAKKQIAFSWNAPPHLPDARKVRTRVDVRVEPGGAENVSRVTLHHTAWPLKGQNAQVDEAYDYFVKAWDTVLANLVKRFATPA